MEKSPSPPRPVNVFFFGSKDIGAKCFEYLLEKRSEFNINILGIMSNDRALRKDGPTVKQLASAAGIDLIPNLETYLTLPQVDLAISVQYHEILKPVHIAKAENITVNYHMAPLPEYRGCNQFTLAIINKDTEFGTTVHRLEPSIDGGAIIAERRFPIPDGAWVQDLYELTFQETITLFRDSLPNLVKNEFSLTPQSSYVGSRKTTLNYRKEIEHLKRVGNDWPAEKILRYIRATTMPGFSPPYMEIDGVRIQLLAQRPGQN